MACLRTLLLSVAQQTYPCDSIIGNGKYENIRKHILHGFLSPPFHSTDSRPPFDLDFFSRNCLLKWTPGVLLPSVPLVSSIPVPALERTFKRSRIKVQHLLTSRSTTCTRSSEQRKRLALFPSRFCSWPGSRSCCSTRTGWGVRCTRVRLRATRRWPTCTN